MSVTVMEKLTALCLQSDIERLLGDLTALSCVEILTADARDEQGILLQALSADSEAAKAAALRIDELLPIFQARSPRRARGLRTPIPVDTEEFARTGARERAEKTADEAERLLAHIAELTEKKAEEQAEMAALLPYLSHTFALDDPGTKSTTFLLGSLPAGTNTAEIDKKAAATGFVFEVLTTDKTHIYIAAITHRAMQDEVLSALGELGFAPAVWRNNHGRATALFDAAGARAAVLDDEITRANAQLDTLADNLTDLRILSDILHTEAGLAAYREKMQALDSCAVLQAWCPSHERERITALLEELDVAFRFAPPATGERVPVLDRTPPQKGRLAPILNAYAYPYALGRSIALPLQIVLFLFFGLLFADAGYGVLTALLFFPIARFLAVEKQAKSAFYTLACCGLAMIPLGVLTGSYFDTWLGTLLEKGILAPFPPLAAHIAELRAYLITPQGFLLPALSFSLLVLLINLTARLTGLWRAGKPLDAILSVLPELFTLTGLGLAVFYPLIGAGTTLLGLILTALIATHAVKGMRSKLVAYGGALLSLLVTLFELLGAARIALVGLALLPVTRLIALMPLERGEALVWYLGQLLVFLISHLLGVLLNRIIAAMRRARLAYMAHHEAHYPAHEILFRPMQLPRKYTVCLPAYVEKTDAQQDDEAPAAGEAAPVTSTTQKL